VYVFQTQIPITYLFASPKPTYDSNGMHVPFGDDISKSPTKWAMRTNSLGDFSALYSLVSLCFLKFIFTLKQVLLLVPSCWWALPASIHKERIPETPNSPLGFIEPLNTKYWMLLYKYLLNRIAWTAIARQSYPKPTTSYK
jgi:hypothetical protein